MAAPDSLKPHRRVIRRVLAGMVLLAGIWAWHMQVTGGLLVAQTVEEIGSTGLVCTLGNIQPLVGTVRIDLDDPELVWIERPDGSRASVRWPSGFSLDRTVPAVRDPTGGIVATEGLHVSFATLGAATGTGADPFMLGGRIAGHFYC